MLHRISVNGMVAADAQSGTVILVDESPAILSKGNQMAVWANVHHDRISFRAFCRYAPPFFPKMGHKESHHFPPLIRGSGRGTKVP